jgi:hypothetical protein
VAADGIAMKESKRVKGLPSWIPDFGSFGSNSPSFRAESLGTLMSRSECEGTMKASVDENHSLHCELVHVFTVNRVDDYTLTLLSYNGSTLQWPSSSRSYSLEDLLFFSHDETSLEPGDLVCRLENAVIMVRNVDDRAYKDAQEAPTVVRLVGLAVYWEPDYIPHGNARKFIIV